MSINKFKQVRIYACGGTGINLANKFTKLIKPNTIGMCDSKVVYLDTSTSNINYTDAKEEDIYLLEGKEGSGKKRSLNYEDVVKKAPEFMANFRPSEDINIILSSASGGSGSTIGQVIAHHLLDRGLPFIVILVGSTYSEIEIDNTIKVLQGYELMASRNERPILLHYIENNEDNLTGENDSKVLDFMTLTSFLFSGHHKALDSVDLRNFMDYTTVTSYPPKLISLDFYSEGVSLNKSEKVYTMTSIGTDRVAPDILVDYHAEGFMIDEVKEYYPHPLPLRCVTVDGRIQNNIKKLNEKLNLHKEQKRVGISDSIVDKSVSNTATDLGIIL